MIEKSPPVRKNIPFGVEMSFQQSPITKLQSNDL